MDDVERYERASHAVQTGVAYDLEHDPSSGTPKHLRVGINLRATDHAALAGLLIAKGIITTDEYLKALADEAEAEVKRYETILSARVGATVTLR